MHSQQPTTLGRAAHRILAGALLLLGALAACADERSTTAPRLADGALTLDALGAAIWDAIVIRDTAALERLRLTEYEHNQLVWPEQPAAREPSAAANLDFWWQNIQRRNRAARDDLLAVYGGSTLALQRVECIGEPREYRTFTALVDCRLVLAGSADPLRLEAFRYVIRMAGVHKVVRYHGDE